MAMSLRTRNNILIVIGLIMLISSDVIADSNDPDRMTITPTYTQDELDSMRNYFLQYGDEHTYCTYIFHSSAKKNEAIYNFYMANTHNSVNAQRNMYDMITEFYQSIGEELNSTANDIALSYLKRSMEQEIDNLKVCSLLLCGIGIPIDTIKAKEYFLITFKHRNLSREKLEKLWIANKKLYVKWYERDKKAREEIDQILKNLKDNEIKLHTITAAKKSLDDMNEDEIEIEIENQEVDINDYVKIKDTNMQGKIIRKVKNNLTVVTQEGLTVNTKTSKVIKIVAPTKKAAPKMSRGDQFIFKQSVPLELNVIGLHVEEALDKVEKYLDTCIARKVKSCRLIHGSGTGALRTAIHNYLKTLKAVDSYRFGGAGEGGVGATVVTLK